MPNSKHGWRNNLNHIKRKGHDWPFFHSAVQAVLHIPKLREQNERINRQNSYSRGGWDTPSQKLGPLVKAAKITRINVDCAASRFYFCRIYYAYRVNADEIGRK